MISPDDIASVIGVSVNVTYSALCNSPQQAINRQFLWLA